MILSQPPKIIFWISVIAVLLGIVAYYFGVFSGFAFWLVVLGYLLLLIGNTLKFS